MNPVLHRKAQCLAELEIEEIVERCLRHDQQAWSEFLRRYIPLIKRSIKTTLRRSGFPEYEDIDVIDEIWIRIFEKLYKDNKLELCVNLAGIDAWLITISMNQTYDWLKNKTRSGQIVIWKGNVDGAAELYAGWDRNKKKSASLILIVLIKNRYLIDLAHTAISFPRTQYLTSFRPMGVSSRILVHITSFLNRRLDYSLKDNLLHF